MSTDRTTARVQGDVSEPLRDDQPVLEVSNITKSYSSVLPFKRNVSVLEGVNLKVMPGDIVGIVGENGAGKSTLMKTIAGILESDDGTVSLNGTLGWCPQEPLLYERLTVEETFHLFGEAYDMTDLEIEDAIDELTTALDFEQYRGYQTRNLSGGNKQKINLSIALMHDPDLLLLDEPYTGFDWETYLAFWELTERLTESDIGIVVISHLINDRDRFDYIYELTDGVLVRDDTDE